jgi:hypothetical protein
LRSLVEMSLVEMLLVENEMSLVETVEMPFARDELTICPIRSCFRLPISIWIGPKRCCRASAQELWVSFLPGNDQSSASKIFNKHVSNCTGLDGVGPIQTRVARFFLVQNTKMGEKIPNYHELYQIPIKYNKRP